MENPFNNSSNKPNNTVDDLTPKTETPGLPNKMPLSPKKQFQERDPDEVIPQLDKRRGTKKVAFASSSKMIESGSEMRRSSNKSYHSDL